MKYIDNEIIDQLWGDIFQNNSILFLGQNYQETVFGENLFCKEIDLKICKGTAPTYSYYDIWNAMCGKQDRLTLSQKEELGIIASRLPESDNLKKLMSIKWSSVITSAIDDGVMRRGKLSRFDPIFDVRSRKTGLANKKNLHISYLFGCISEPDTIVDEIEPSNSNLTDANDMLRRVIDEVIPFSGCFIIDGWKIEEDWIDKRSLFEKFDPQKQFPEVFLFSCDSPEELRKDRRIRSFIDSDQFYYSEKSFLNCFSDYLNEYYEIKEEEEATLDDNYEILSFRVGKNPVEIRVPQKKIYQLDQDKVCLITTSDRTPIPYDKDGIRNVTTAFFSNPAEKFPYWQGYLHDCYFNRDVYTMHSKRGLKDVVNEALESSNLHQAKNTIVLYGPANSGKSTILGKLAMDFSMKYPVLYIKGSLEDEYGNTNEKYNDIAQFINTYLSKPAAAKRINRGRVLVIWDNNVFIDDIHEYENLSNALDESNVVLVGSAYPIYGIEDFNRKKNRNLALVEISPTLSGIEKNSLETVLRNNLGDYYADIVRTIGKTVGGENDKEKSTEVYRMEKNDYYLLNIINRLFVMQREEAFQSIAIEAFNRSSNEADLNDAQMKEYLKITLDKVKDRYSIEREGLASVAKAFVPDKDREEEWYKAIIECAPRINDIIAIAGQFGLRIPVNLLIRTIISEYPVMIKYTDVIEELISRDSMLSYPFIRDEYGVEFVGYRDQIEANNYLNMHYLHKEEIDNSSSEISREDMEIDTVISLVKNSRLEEYEGSNFSTVRAVKELIDQFGPNSRRGDTFAKRYNHRYKELANCLMEYGGEENPEITLCAAFLIRESQGLEMYYLVTSNNDITSEQKRELDKCETALEKAIEIEDRNSHGTSSRMMRLYLEWCTNRNYVLSRKNPGKNDLLLFKKIHSRFAQALSIYVSRDNNPVGPMKVLDIYLNAFGWYERAMEKIYHVQTDSNAVKGEILEAYNNELFFALERAIGNLLDIDYLGEKKTQIEKITRVYELANKSMSILKSQARAKGNSAFIALQARSLWIEKSGEDDNTYIDWYLISDYADESEVISTGLIDAAYRVYEYLTSNDNYRVIMSSPDRLKRERGSRCLEMLIRSAWIYKTRSLPFRLNQKPSLKYEDWRELHGYCEKYIKACVDNSKYAFACYLEGIYLFTFTEDRSYNYDLRPSVQMFKMWKSSRRPREVRKSDSYIILCKLGTKSPIIFDVNIIRQNTGRMMAAIIDSENPTDINYMSNLKTRKIFCAQSLVRELKQGVHIQNERVTLRFNLEGALAGPVEV